jgi:hypothetical protein
MVFRLLGLAFGVSSGLCVLFIVIDTRKRFASRKNLTHVWIKRQVPRCFFLQVLGLGKIPSKFLDKPHALVVLYLKLAVHRAMVYNDPMELSTCKRELMRVRRRSLGTSGKSMSKEGWLASCTGSSPMKKARKCRWLISTESWFLGRG